MEIKIVNIDTTTLSDIVEPCRTCCYWECREQFSHGKHIEQETKLKAEWFEKTQADFSPCGKALYVDDVPAAYCQYAPPKYVPNISEYDELAKHVDMSGVFISCLFVPSQRRLGLGRRLLEEVIDEVRDRGFRVIETYGRDDSSDYCSGPTQFYLAHGFTVVATQVFPNGVSLSLVQHVLT